MKILFIFEMLSFFPCFDGFRLIPDSLLKELSKNYEIYLIAFYADKKDLERTDSVARYCKFLDMVYYSTRHHFRAFFAMCCPCIHVVWKCPTG